MKVIVYIFILIILPIAAGCRTTVPRQEENQNPEHPIEIDEQKPQIETREGKKEDEQSDPSQKTIVDNRPDSRGRPVRTRFYGNELWRERALVDGAEITRISIIGNATIEHEGVLIVSPKIVIDAGTIGRCEGGVRIIDRKNGLNIYAESARYDRSAQKVELTGNPYMIVQKEGKKPVLISSVRMMRDLQESVSILDQDVRAYNEGWFLFGSQAQYIDRDDVFKIDQNPVVLGKDQFLTGNSLVYYPSLKKIILTGEVVQYAYGGGLDLAPRNDRSERPTLENYARSGGRRQNPETAAEEKPAEPLVSIISSDSLEYDFSKEEPVTELKGSVVLSRGGLKMVTEYLMAIGKDYHLIHTDRGIDMIDRERNVHVVSGTMDYNRSTQNLRLENSPRMDFMKKGTDEINAVLTGTVIERNFNSGETQARGNVTIERDNYKATGEMATYHENEDLIVMEGAPSLKQGNGTVECEKILIYPDKNRVLLVNRIRGYVLE